MATQKGNTAWITSAMPPEDELQPSNPHLIIFIIYYKKSLPNLSPEGKEETIYTVLPLY